MFCKDSGSSVFSEDTQKGEFSFFCPFHKLKTGAMERMKGMEKILWAICLVYWALAAVGAKKKRDGFLPFGLLGGWLVAFFCFCFLPPVFTEGGAVLPTALALLGTLAGTWAERRGGRHFWEAAAFTAAAFVYGGSLPQALWAILGGFCLYLACGAVLPEEKTEKEMLWQGLGGVLGFLGGILCCFP